METLLADQSTADDKIITPPGAVPRSRPTGGAARLCGAIAVASRRPRPATVGRPLGGPQLPRRRGYTAIVAVELLAPVTRDASA